MDKGKWMLTMGAFVSMSFIGMSRTFLGTALPAIRSTLGLNLLEAGTLTALLQLGFSIAVFVGGPFSDVLKKKTVLTAGCLLMGINLLVFGFSEWFWLCLVGIIFIGIGGGLIESSSNPLILQLYQGREAMVMQLHHFFFAVGSLTGPAIMGALLTRSLPWQWAYMGFGFFVSMVFLFLLFQRATPLPKRSGFDFRLIGKLVTETTFLSLFFITFFNSGVQNGICFWMVTFLKEARDLPIALASSSLLLFFACVALGRLCASYLLTRLHETSYLLCLFLLLGTVLIAAIMTPGKWAIPFFALSGLALSGVFPSLLGMGGKIYSEIPGAAMGILATGAGLGSVLVPWIVSLVSQFTDLRTGFLCFEVFVMVCLALLGFQFRELRRLIPLRVSVP